MLSEYIEGFDAETWIRKQMEKTGMTKTDVLKDARTKIPKESYFQNKIKQAVKRKYPTAYIHKVAQGLYSEGGTPDLMVIYKGHYFGFEVKRPVVGKVSGLQEFAIQKIKEAGGTAAVVRWPEEALAIIGEWDKEH